MIYDIYCVGMRVEKFCDEEAGESAFDFEPCENTIWNLFCTSAEGRVKFIITLRNVIGWCGSGYTTDCNGFISVKFVHDFGPLTHKIRGKHSYKFENLSYDGTNGWSDDAITLKFVYGNFEIDYEDDEYDTGVFSFHDHGDSYYPDNWYEVNMDIFEELPRTFEKRPVWVFSGPSAVGKSTLGYYLENHYEVYETDSANNGNLPDEIWADIIILGNKWKNITLEEVKKHIVDAEVIEVSFERGERA